MAGMSRSFRVEAIAPGLSAARLTQTLTLNWGAGEVLDMWHSLQSEAVNTHPLLCRLAQLQGPSPQESHIYQTFMRGTAQGMPWPIKGPLQGVPKLCTPEHCTRCDTSTVLWVTRPNWPSSGKASGHYPWPMSNPLDSILFSRGPSPARRPEGGEQDIAGTHGGVMFLLNLSLSVSLSSPLSLLFLFLSFLFLSLCLFYY